MTCVTIVFVRRLQALTVKQKIKLDYLLSGENKSFRSCISTFSLTLPLSLWFKWGQSLLWLPQNQLSGLLNTGSQPHPQKSSLRWGLKPGNMNFGHLLSHSKAWADWGAIANTLLEKWHFLLEALPHPRSSASVLPSNVFVFLCLKQDIYHSTLPSPTTRLRIL